MYNTGYGYATGYSQTYALRRMTFEQQKKHVEKLLKKCGPPTPGQTWCAIDSEWFMRFNESEEKPGNIDNSALWDQEREGLKFDVEEKTHYELLPLEVYNFLKLHYRCRPELKFTVKKDSSDNPVIDLYPAYFLVSVEEAEKSTDDSDIDDDEDEEEGENENDQVGEEPKDETSEKAEEEGVEAEKTETPQKDSEAEEVANEGEQKEEEPKEEKSKPVKKYLLKMSRYHKLGKLKGSIARLLELRPQQLTILVQEAGGEDAGFKALDELSQEELSRQIYETLTDIGKIVWKVKCIKAEIDESALNAHEAFSRTEPSVGQRVDAKMQDRWLEAEIVEVLEPKENSGSQEPVPRVKVHYLSFDKSKDQIFDVTSEDIDIAYAHLADWRQQTRKGLKVEINKRVFSMSNDWIEGEIVKIDRKGVSSLKSHYAKQLAGRHNKKADKSIMKKIKGFFSKSKPKDENSAKSGPTRNRSDTVDSDDLDVSYQGLVQVVVKAPLQGGYYYRQIKKYVVDLGSQDIAVAGTHLQKKKPTAFASLMSKDVSKKPKAHGAIGLRNLGNTCYMNSILQCLMATEPMTKYFLSGEYKKDINRKNVIGFGGRVAVAYGELAEKYFSDKFSIIGPSNFKRVFGSCCTTFAGTSQQDSQEFLTQLLDALHEDLNKVLTKPIVEAPDSDGRPDAEIAKISWDNHLARNKSMFVDHMFGLLKSHLVCPNEKCKNEATKFDPFSNLVLPIPVKDEFIVNIVFVTLRPRRVRIRLSAVEDKKVEFHDFVKDDYEPTDDEHIQLTRHFRFHYLVKGTKLYGTECTAWLAERMYISPEKISLHTVRDNSVIKCINDPLSNENFFIRVNDKTQFMAFENNDIDFPLLKTLYDMKAKPREKATNTKKKGIEDKKKAVAEKDQKKITENKAKEEEGPAENEEKSDGKEAETVDDAEKNVTVDEAKDTSDKANEAIAAAGIEKPGDNISKTESTPEELKEENTVALSSESNKPTTKAKDTGKEDGQKEPKKTSKTTKKTGKTEKSKKLMKKEKKTKKQKKAEALAKQKAKNEKKNSRNKAGQKKAVSKTKTAVKEKSSKLKRKEKTKADAKTTETGEKSKKSEPVTTKKSDKAESEKEESSEEEPEEEDRFAIMLLKFAKLGVSHYAATVKNDEVFLFDAEQMSHQDIFIQAWLRVSDLLDLEHPKLQLKELPKDPEEARMAVGMKAIKVMYDKTEIKPDKEAFLKLKKAKYQFQLAAVRTIKVYLRSTDFFKKEIKGSAPSASFYYKKPTIEDMDKKFNVGFVAHTPSIREFAQQKEIVTLEKCFKALNTPEKLENEVDWWYCNKCKAHVPATKKMDVFSAGDILVIVLKRFKAGAAFIRRKIEEHVQFPLKDLDLSEYIQDNEHSKIYDLYAVSYHSGGLGSGHYTAKALIGEQWFNFNDSSVQACTEESVVNRFAYVLFYKRRNAL